ncbi:MAG: IMP cyclohydrolase [Clostridia bacterium]
MNVYEAKTIGERIIGNAYVGRGIINGKTADGTHAVNAYFIMGRSENSRNRIFATQGSDIITKAFDESKLEDPSLIIYSAIKEHENKLIVTNGDQTDTIYDFIVKGDSFINSLYTREFEPDAPNFTPRISTMTTFNGSDFSYEMSILKSSDKVGSACSRFFFSYPALCGVGHFIHTYVCDGDPIPTFMGEPERISIPNSIDELTADIWNNLNEENKISLYVRYTNLETKEVTSKLINKNQ